MTLENLLRNEGSTFVLRDNRHTDNAIVHIVESLVQTGEYSVDAHKSMFFGITTQYLGTIGRLNGELCHYDRNNNDSVIEANVDTKMIREIWRKSCYMSIDMPMKYGYPKKIAYIAREAKPVLWTKDKDIDDFCHETFSSMPECPILLKREQKEDNVCVTMDTRGFMYPLEPVRNGKMILRAGYGLAKDFAYAFARSFQ